MDNWCVEDNYVKITLKVGMKLSQTTLVAPNYVIWKQLLDMWSPRDLEVVFHGQDIPAASPRSGAGVS